MSIVGRPLGLKTMDHSGSCRCHIVAATGPGMGGKAETAWGIPVTGGCGLACAWPPGTATQGCP